MSAITFAFALAGFVGLFVATVALLLAVKASSGCQIVRTHQVTWQRQHEAELAALDGVIKAMRDAIAASDSTKMAAELAELRATTRSQFGKLWGRIGADASSTPSNGVDPDLESLLALQRATSAQ